MQQQQQLAHQRGSFSALSTASTASSSTATSSITAVSNANSSRQHPYPQPQFGGNGNSSNNPNSSNNSVYNMFSHSGAHHPPHNLRPPFYPPIPPMHYCPQCPPMIGAHPPSVIGGGFAHPGVGSSQHLPPPAYPNNNMAPSTTSSSKISAVTTSSTSNGSSSRKRSYAEATASGSLQQHQIHQRMQFQQLQQQAQAEEHRQQMNMRIGRNGYYMMHYFR